MNGLNRRPCDGCVKRKRETHHNRGCKVLHSYCLRQVFHYSLQRCLQGTDDGPYRRSVLYCVAHYLSPVQLSLSVILFSLRLVRAVFYSEFFSNLFKLIDGNYCGAKSAVFQPFSAAVTSWNNSTTVLLLGYLEAILFLQLSFNQRIDLEDGLEDVVDYISDNCDASPRALLEIREAARQEKTLPPAAQT